MTTQKNLSKRGLVKYDYNPFIGGAIMSTQVKNRRIVSKDKRKMMTVSDEDGEVISNSTGFWYYEEVDKTQFVKLYINGVRAFKELTSAGTKVFELFYTEVQKNIGKDEIWLSFNSINQLSSPMSRATFQRGLNELITKNFLAESKIPSRYFINPDFVWNGDRLSFVRQVRLKTAESQQSLFEEDPVSIAPSA